MYRSSLIAVSKRFINPTQKGVDLFPDGTRLPIKLVIPGTEHDPALRAQVIADHSGQLAAFQRKQTQLASLSPGTWYNQSLTLPDAKMTYTNNLGQETLKLEVHPSKLVPAGGDYWDWALIDVVLAGAGSQLSLEGLAIMRSPPGDPIDVGQYLPHRGVAVGGVLTANTAATEQVLFATPSGGVTTPSIDAQYASFYVDLRRFRSVKTAFVDLYAAIGVVPETIPRLARFYAVGPGSDGAYLHGSEPHPIRAYASPWPPTSPDALYSWGTGGSETYWAPFPPYHFDTSSHRWVLDAAYETVTYAVGYTLSFSEDRYTVDTNFFPWVVYAVGSNPNDYVPAGPQTATVTVHARMFKGAPAVVPTTAITPDGTITHRWVVDNPVPGAIPPIGQRLVAPDSGGDLTKQLGFTSLGRLSLDLVLGGTALGAPA